MNDRARMPAAYQLRRVLAALTLGYWGVRAARHYDAAPWLQLAGFLVVITAAIVALGPVFERQSRRLPPGPKRNVTKREALELIAVSSLFPLSLAAVLVAIRSGVGTPQLMLAFFYGISIVNGVLLWFVTQRWRRLDGNPV